jgi:DNA polymerase elongation subunit (family B)
MKGFIVYPTYRIKQDKSFVVLIGKLENGESFATATLVKPYFFIRESDLKKAKKLDNFESEKTNLKNFDDKKVTKIILNTPSEVRELKKLFEEESIPCYEADIRLVYRYLIDNNILGSIEIEGDYENNNEIDRFYREPEIKPSSHIPKLKTLSIDIETNVKTSEILAISLYTEDYKQVLITSNKKLKNAISCSTEEDLLGRFHDKIKEIDPDIITGWNVIDFDLAVIKKRFKKHDIPFTLGRDNSVCKLKLDNNFFKASKADFPGRIVLDGINLLKSSFIKLESYKLDEVAKHYLKDKKLISFKNKGKEIQEMSKDNPQKLVDYNLKDAELAYKIIHKSDTLNLTIQRSLLTGLPLDRVSASIASLDQLYLKEARKKGLVCPSAEYNIKEERITGGYVQESEPGIYDYILVLDFKSLYPSIIKTFNIDPASFLTKCNKDAVKAPNGACFKNTDGILPIIIEKLWEEREKSRKNKNELSRYAIKILMNSLFGVLASPSCRFFSLDVANAITHFGQHLIKLTAEKVKEQGYNVIYSDSVKGNRFVTMLDPNGLIKIIRIEEFFKIFSNQKFKNRNKEFCDIKNYKALTINPKTYKPEFKPIKRVIRHKVKKDIYRIIQKFGETEVTADHSLMCWKNKQLIATKPKDIHKHMIASVRRIPDVKILKVIDIFEYLKDFKYLKKYKGKIKKIKIKIEGNYLTFGWMNRKNTIKLKRFIKVDSNDFLALCRLLGAYIGDGSSCTPDTTSTRWCASIANTDIKLLNQLKKDYNLLFKNTKCKIIKSTTKPRQLKYKTANGNWKDINYEDKTYKLQMMSQIAAIFFKGLAGQKSIGKKIPQFIYHVNKKYQDKFLEYLILTDGSKKVNETLHYSQMYKEKNFKYTTKSLELVSGITLLLRQLNQNYALSFRPEKETYAITTSDKVNNRLITKIKKEKFEGYVYDLEVEDNHMFVDSCGQILLHNTDSIFVVPKVKSLAEANKIGEKLEKGINEFYSKHIQEKYKRKSFLELEYEKCFIKFLMPKLRGKEGGAKKRYAGLLMKKKKEKIEVTGMEVVRSDWTDLAKDFQSKLLDLIFHDKDPAYFINKYVNDLLKGKLDDKLIYRKSIRKDLKEYTKTTPPHVKAARKLNKLESNLIEYVLTTDGPEPIQDIKHEIDYEHYINKQIKPIADTILLFLNKDFEDIRKGSKQTSLANY